LKAKWVDITSLLKHVPQGFHKFYQALSHESADATNGADVLDECCDFCDDVDQTILDDLSDQNISPQEHSTPSSMSLPISSETRSGISERVVSDLHTPVSAEETHESTRDASLTRGRLAVQSSQRHTSRQSTQTAL